MEIMIESQRTVISLIKISLIKSDEFTTLFFRFQSMCILYGGSGNYVLCSLSNYGNKEIDWIVLFSR